MITRSQIRLIVALIGAYVVCQAVADVGATKMVQIGSVVLPGGTFVFALTFTLRDMVHKRLGREFARAAIVAAGVLNVFMAAYLGGVARLPAPAFFSNAEAWDAIFLIVPAIVTGSIVAEVVSELVDTEIWHAAVTALPQWAAVALSNSVALSVDSLVFGTLAFVVLPPVFGAEPLAFLDAMSVVKGQLLWKALVTVASLPLVYAVKNERAVAVA